MATQVTSSNLQGFLSTLNLENTYVTSDIFRYLWPISQPQSQEKYLDVLLLAFKKRKIQTIQTIQGTNYYRLEFTSLLHQRLYEQCEDFNKAKIIAITYENLKQSFSPSTLLTEDAFDYLEEKIIKYADFIGVNNEIIRLILINQKTIKKHIENNVITTALLDEFFGQVSRDLLSEIKHLSTTDPKRILIGTSSSGGAHKSISDSIAERLQKLYQLTIPADLLPINRSI